MKMTKDHKMLMEDMGVECNHFKKLCDAIRIGLEFTPLYEREKNIVLGVLCGGKTLKEVGAEYDITQERTRQIYEKALRRLRDAIRLYVNEQDELHEEVAKLRVENERLRLKNEEMAQLLRKAEVEPLTISDKLKKEQLTILATPIKELDTSIRLQRCCCHAELETLGDVLRMDKRELLKIRNFGRKSLTELCEIFAKHGIEWGYK